MSTTGLKAFLPTLARLLGDQSAIALYERQKMLVIEGVLHPVPGRGPGSGVRATPETIAMLLIALLASGSSGPRVRGLAEAITAPPGAPPKPCGLTDATRFVDALARVLSDEALAARVSQIYVTASHRYATVRYGDEPLPVATLVLPPPHLPPDGPKLRSSTFVDPNRPDPAPAISTDSSIENRTIRALAAAVKDMTASNAQGEMK
jgi:hypothetical protein